MLSASLRCVFRAAKKNVAKIFFSDNHYLVFIASLTFRNLFHDFFSLFSSFFSFVNIRYSDSWNPFDIFVCVFVLLFINEKTKMKRKTYVCILLSELPQLTTKQKYIFLFYYTRSLLPPTHPLPLILSPFFPHPLIFFSPFSAPPLLLPSYPSPSSPSSYPHPPSLPPPLTPILPPLPPSPSPPYPLTPPLQK